MSQHWSKTGEAGHMNSSRTRTPETLSRAELPLPKIIPFSWADAVPGLVNQFARGQMESCPTRSSALCRLSAGLFQQFARRTLVVMNMNT
jgi:hypothetical protein